MRVETSHRIRRVRRWLAAQGLWEGGIISRGGGGRWRAGHGVRAEVRQIHGKAKVQRCDHTYLISKSCAAALVPLSMFYSLKWLKTNIESLMNISKFLWFSRCTFLKFRFWLKDICKHRLKIISQLYLNNFYISMSFNPLQNSMRSCLKLLKSWAMV